MRMRIAIALILAAGIAVGLGAPASADDTFAKGLASFNAGEWAMAATNLLAAAPLAPSDLVVRVTAGVALANVRRYPEALEQFKAAARLTPNGILPPLLLDGVYSEMGKTIEARQIRYNTTQILTLGRAFGTASSSDRILQASLTRYPQNAIVHCLLGDLYQLQGKLPSAKEQYSEASRLCPTWAKPVFNLGLAELNTNPKAAEERFRYVMKVDPANSRAHLWLGDAFLRQKKFADAISEYQIAGKNPVLWAESQTRIGNAQMQTGDYSAASSRFERAAEVAPQDPRPLAGKAQVMESTGQLAGAQQNYKRAASVMYSNSAPPTSQAVVQNQLGTVNAKMGNLTDAESNFQAAYDLHPSLKNASQLVDAQQKAKVMPLSVSTYEEALRKDPRDMRALLYLLYAHKSAGNNAGQLEMATRLLKVDPSNARVYYAEIGAAQMRLGDAAKAKAAYISALDAGNALTWAETAASAANSGALDSLIQVYSSSFNKHKSSRTGKVLLELQSARGDTPGVVETAEKLVKLSPGDPALELTLGQAYESTGNISSAIAIYTKTASGPDADATALARNRLEAIRAKAKK